MKRRQDVSGPIILGNAPSCGSTLLRVLLGRHPMIVSGGELAILDKPALLDEAATHYRERIQTWLNSGYPADFTGASRFLFEFLDEYPWDSRGVTELSRQAVGIADLLTQFYSPMLAAAGARRWLEKTPSNVYNFDRISAMFPGARLVHITRDARDCIPSYCRRQRSDFRAVSRWYYATLTGIQYRGRPDYYELRYEDLVANPRATLQNLCEFIGEEFVPEMLRPDQPETYGYKPAGWRHDPAGSVSTGDGCYRVISGDDNHRCGMTVAQGALFRCTRLSEYGALCLPDWSPLRQLPSPLALQKYLGYGTDSLTDGRQEPLNSLPTRNTLLAHWSEFLTYREWVWQKYRRRVRCHTRLCLDNC